MASLFTVCVLISGRGSNLKSLICNQGDYKISSVFSDNINAPGQEFAKAANIPFKSLNKHDYQERNSFLYSLLSLVDRENIDLICLAGFMRILPENFITRNFGRIINIHPALLPKFPGLHTHERALEANESIHGCSVHYVDAGVDTGPIIAQAQVPCYSTDTVDSLSSRVLEKEHLIYPWVVSKIASKGIRLEGRTVVYEEGIRQEGQKLGFYLGEK